jgi:hypothetical protein
MTGVIDHAAFQLSVGVPGSNQAENDTDRPCRFDNIGIALAGMRPCLPVSHSESAIEHCLVFASDAKAACRLLPSRIGVADSADDLCLNPLEILRVRHGRTLIGKFADKRRGMIVLPRENYAHRTRGMRM